MTVGVTAAGTTTSSTDGQAGASCGLGGSNARDAAFAFTAPSTGNYRLSTQGSSFDTILYVRAGTCLGAELACNDDGAGIGLNSSLTVTLAAGQTIAVAVDGYATASGSFSLLVTSVP